MIVIKMRLDDEEEFFSLENISRFLLKYKETLNKMLLISSLKENSMALGPMKPHFKNKFTNQKKFSHAPKRDFKKSGNKQ